jgi:hypothetical protein
MTTESIYDGLPYIYAEQLNGKKFALTIKSVTGGAEFHNPQTHEVTIGFDIAFEETPKLLGVTGVTVRRQLYAATGAESPADMAGKKIVLYPVKSTRAATGQAIRIAPYKGGE